MTRGSADRDRPLRQLMFGFPAPGATWDGLLQGAHNAAALRKVVQPGGWAMPAMVITGPVKCGLSYLGSAWAARFDGECIAGALLAQGGRRRLDGLAGRHVALDDADLGAGRHEESLLSLINLMAAGGGRLLLLSHLSPAGWRASSPDLRSRLNAMPVAEILPPDEEVLRSRLAMAATARFLRLSPETLNYLVPRLELAYEAVESFMDRLSEAVSDNDRAPSLPLARRVLEQMDPAARDGDAEG